MDKQKWVWAVSLIKGRSTRHPRSWTHTHTCCHMTPIPTEFHSLSSTSSIPCGYTLVPCQGLQASFPRSSGPVGASGSGIATDVLMHACASGSAEFWNIALHTLFLPSNWSLGDVFWEASLPFDKTNNELYYNTLHLCGLSFIRFADGEITLLSCLNDV